MYDSTVHESSGDPVSSQHATQKFAAIGQTTSNTMLSLHAMIPEACGCTQALAESVRTHATLLHKYLKSRRCRRSTNCCSFCGG